MLEEARADMDALVEDARTVPFQALRDAPALMPPPEPPMLEEPFITAPPPPIVSVTAAAPPMSTATSRVLLSSPFPSEAVPVPSGNRAPDVRHALRCHRHRRPRWNDLVASFVGRSLSGQRRDRRRHRRRPRRHRQRRPSHPAASPTSAPASPAPAANAAAPSSSLSLLVEARRSSWLRTTIDGESDSGRTLDEGETFRITAQRSVSLRVGDAGAVFVSVNNGEAVPLGRAGQVVTRQFVVEKRRARAVRPDRSRTAPSQSEARAAAASDRIGSAAGPGPVPTPVPLVQPVAAAPARAPSPRLRRHQHQRRERRRHARGAARGNGRASADAAGRTADTGPVNSCLRGDCRVATVARRLSSSGPGGDGVALERRAAARR